MKRHWLNPPPSSGGARQSVYDGWTVQGWPRFVVRRGQIVLADGEITAQPGQGRWLRRGRTGHPEGPGGVARPRE